MDLLEYQRAAWNTLVKTGDRWTVPVAPEVVARARQGDWNLILTPNKPVPRDWFPKVEGADVLCLASGGGQQGPILAAAGARVTVLDNSPAQLGQDRMVAERDGLELATVEGDMADLSAFGDASFDLVFHPVSNCFIPNVLPVWRECFRVLRPGGLLLAGVTNPIAFAFDPDLQEKGIHQLRYALPYSDLTSLTDEERRRYTDPEDPLCFGHSLEDQLGGQLRAGFVLTGLYEDLGTEEDPLAKLLPTFIATRAVKPG